MVGLVIMAWSCFLFSKNLIIAIMSVSRFYCLIETVPRKFSDDDLFGAVSLVGKVSP